MAVVTAVGVLGALATGPFIGVLVYYFFAVLRPQYLWKWALPENIGWSGYVAWATLFATVLMVLGGNAPVRAQRFSGAHRAFFLFGAWICLTYITSMNKEIAYFWLLEYVKIFLMFGVGAIVISTIRQLWTLYLAATVALMYIAYEMNFLYLVEGRLDIYHNGYGGLDNNGAALMLAMGVPLAMSAWEGMTKIWRWAFIAAVPVLIHAVLMSYSRGAMVSLLVVTPFLILRSRRKAQFGLLLVAVLATVPFLAGKEIRNRFFSVQEYNADESAQSRFDSWDAAVRIANDHPIFGAGIRNSNLLTYQYGADIEGRTIHSQYLQTLADSGYVGLGLYLVALGSLWLSILRTRRFLKTSDDPDASLARSMLAGVEGALVVFCFGASFLSLEVFELPYLVALIGAQISLLTRVEAMATVREPVRPEPFFATPRPRTS